MLVLLFYVVVVVSGAVDVEVFVVVVGGVIVSVFGVVAVIGLVVVVLVLVVCVAVRVIVVAVVVGVLVLVIVVGCQLRRRGSLRLHGQSREVCWAAQFKCLVVWTACVLQCVAVGAACSWSYITACCGS